MSTYPEGPAPDPYSNQPYGTPSTPPTPGYAPGYAPAPGYPPAPGAPGSPYPAQPPGTDGLAIGALVTGILGLAVVPIVLGAISLSRIKRTRQSGRGMAIAGIVLGGLAVVGWTLLTVVLLVLASHEGFSQGFWEGFEEEYSESIGEPSLEASAEAPAEDTTTEDLAQELGLGACFADSEAVDDAGDVVFQDCAGPHSAEVYGEIEIPGAEYPGEEAVFATADEFCLAEFEAFVGFDYEDSVLDFGYFYPTVESWADGDHVVNCYVVMVDESDLTGTARGIGR